MNLRGELSPTFEQPFIPLQARPRLSCWSCPEWWQHLKYNTMFVAVHTRVCVEEVIVASLLELCFWRN